jgi:cyclopropane-fatty-acyl-phospholipid synthase
MVFRIELAKRSNTVPLTRDFVVDWERANMPAIRRHMRATE